MSIDTLVKDIRDRLVSTEPISDEVTQSFAHNLANKLAIRLGERRGGGNLRLSNLGTECNRKLWYAVNKPELGAKLSASTRLKFLFGDILEELLLFLAKASGHSVSNEQMEVDLHGVKGHIDGFVDGELVDCKSASTYSFLKFKNNALTTEDSFGYITQNDGYLEAAKDQPDLKRKDRFHFLAVDKQHGHIVLDTYNKQHRDYSQIVEQKKQMLDFPQLPERGYSDVKEGESGNRKLGLQCSYCPFKTACWPGLRGFLYAGSNRTRKPVFLTKVVRPPKVDEFDVNAVED